MSKELTPLDALKNLRCAVSLGLGTAYEEMNNNCDIIETALKDKEDVIFEQDFYIGVLEHENKKMEKALEFIKKRFTIQFCKSDLNGYYGIIQIGINPIYIKTKEEYDILKEVLL